MKKIVFTIITIGMSLTGIAQDKYVISAITSLRDHQYDEAKDDIDKAIANPETSEKPKALFAKAQIYFQLQTIDKYKASSPYREGTKAAVKLVEVKDDYEKSTVDQMLLNGAYQYYNDGVKAYNDKKLTESSEYMKMVLKVHGLDGGKRFEKSPVAKGFDTVAAGANQIMATSAYYLGNYEEAIPLLSAAKNNPITKSPSIYECLIDAYNKQNKTAEAQATIEEARKTFPEDATIRNYELNELITSGKKDELVKKLEEAAAKDPNNADIQFNIATVYLKMANPTDGSKKPANAAELTAKSEAAYKQALRIAPDNASYNYNFGALYYNNAIDLNTQMNDITGTSDADMKKYDGLKASRDATFNTALPYFEKAYDVLSKQETLKGDDKSTYRSTITALKEIYARQNKMDKSQEMAKKLDAMK